MNIPAEIKVNGKWRPTRNSLGKLIHSTPEGLLAFWKWFGESKVVDDQGRPLVVYHGTDAEFIEFDEWAYMAYTRKEAREYGDTVMPVYVRAVNLVRINDVTEITENYGSRHAGEYQRVFEALDDSSVREEVFATGVDAVEFEDVSPNSAGDSTHEAVLVRVPTQIKSAIGNRGTFDPEDPVMTNPRRWTGSSLGGMGGRKRRSLGLLSDDYYAPLPESEEAALRKKLRANTKFKLPNGEPDLRKIEWFINKLKSEGKL